MISDPYADPEENRKYHDYESPEFDGALYDKPVYEDFIRVLGYASAKISHWIRNPYTHSFTCDQVLQFMASNKTHEDVNICIDTIADCAPLSQPKVHLLKRIITSPPAVNALLRKIEDFFFEPNNRSAAYHPVPISEEVHYQQEVQLADCIASDKLAVLGLLEMFSDDYK